MRRPRAGLLAALLAAGAGPSLAGAGCKSKDAAEAGERQPLAAELLVAPVVGIDPWVMAFLTEISITQPAGADARLEGRAGTLGVRRGEPIIEAESREALAAFLADYERERPRRPELVPVWQRAPFGPEAAVRWRLHFVDRSRGFVVDEQARVGIVTHDHGPTVHVWLGEAQREAFAALTRAQVGERIAVVLDGEVLMLPVVMEPVEDGDIWLVADPHEAPRSAAKQLLARLSAQGHT